MPDRTRPPQQSAVSRVEFQNVITEKLKKGTPFHLLSAGDQEIIRLEVLFPMGGSWFEVNRGAAFFTLKMLREGTKNHSAERISTIISNYGAFLDLKPGFDNAVLILYCLDKHLPRLLSLVYEMLNEPLFDKKELELQQEQQIGQLRIQNSKNNILAGKMLRSSIFGIGHPYGRVMDEEDIRNITPDHLSSFHKNRMKSTEVYLSGRPSDRTIDLVKSSFESQRYEIQSFASLDLALQIELNDRTKDSVQASIRIGRDVILKSHPDYIPLLVTNHLLGGFFGSILMKNIREDKGLTYGISSSLIPLTHASYWIIGTEVKADLVEKALEEIYKEVQGLLEFDNREGLETAKKHLLGSFQAEINTPFDLMEKFKNVHLHGLDYDYYQKFFDNLESFDCDSIRVITLKYLNPDTFKEVVLK